MLELPAAFKARMKEYLGSEAENFFEAYSIEPERGIRLNTLKCTEEKLLKLFEGELKRSPFSPLSFYIDSDIKVGTMPYHSAGAFYSQEPSASSAVTILDPNPGDKVLDMCAAPGGKSTQIAALLQGKGLLWSNEVVKSRANILLSNIERIGVRNAVVSSVYPDVIASKLGGFFDKVLVDAPCSGEGMFRKNPAAIDEWSPEHVDACAARQLAILDSAAECVAEGGVIVYSTCTFSREENEGVTEKFLEKHSDFELDPINVEFGREAFDGIKALRIFPMDGGEGHYVARFIRRSANNMYPKLYNYSKSTNEIRMAEDLYTSIFKDEPFGIPAVFGNNVVLLPEELPDLSKLGVLRAGVPLGEIKKNRIEPHHGLFMAQLPENTRSVIDFTNDSPELRKYLSGEEIDSPYKGFTMVSVDGISIGFGKTSGEKLKNRYPKGLRYH